MATAFRGVFETSLGGFACIRGFAKLGDLALASQPDKDFQRDLIKTHEREIKDFLEDREYLFFPEVILACVLKYDFNKKNAQSGLDPIKNIFDRKNFRSNVDGLFVEFYKSGLAEIRIPPSRILLTRVDGNHRLSAATLKDSFKEYVAPFCIIILPETDMKKEAVIFHNINFRSIPLEFEHSLKMILDDSELFPDAELKKPRLGFEFYLTRKLLPCLQKGLGKNIPLLSFTETNKYRSAVLRTVKYLLREKIIKDADDQVVIVEAAIHTISMTYLNNSVLCQNKNAGVFIALIACQIQKPVLFTSFSNWILTNKLYEIEEIKAESLLSIFKKTLEANSRDIFISTAYNDPASKTNLKTVEEIIAEINSEFKGADFKLNPVCINKPKTACTFQITDHIMKVIENAGLFIADLSGKNQNVYHETGYAMGYIKGKGLTDRVILLMRDFKDADQKVSFNLRGFSQIRFKRMAVLKEQLKAKIKAHYHLVK